MTQNLRVVITDDSALFRAVLKRTFAAIGGVDVVAQAANGAEAISLVRQLNPDLLTLDLNMPVMDGLQTLRTMRELQLRCEVIVVSSETKQGAATTFEALQLGAVDFITKPAEANAQVSSEILAQGLRRQMAGIRLRRESSKLRRDVGSASVSKIVIAAPVLSQSARPVSPPICSSAADIIAIGTSTGGPAALPVLLSGLPSDFTVPIVIVQHMPPIFTAGLAEALSRKSSLKVVEGHDGQLLTRGTVYIAPGGKQMKVRRAFDKSVRLQITDDPPENHCKPSVDVLFRSIAQEYGGNVIAAILTGMGNDGVSGMRQLKAAGAYTIAQDEASCTVFGMPQEAIRAKVVDSVLSLDRIAPAILNLLRSNGS